MIKVSEADPILYLNSVGLIKDLKVTNPLLIWIDALNEKTNL